MTFHEHIKEQRRKYGKWFYKPSLKESLDWLESEILEIDDFDTQYDKSKIITLISTLKNELEGNNI